MWLFYTGFYKKDSMAGITKSQVISYLEDCANTSVSKFDLEDDPREIWGYTNEYSSGLAYNADFDTYVSREGLLVGGRTHLSDGVGPGLDGLFDGELHVAVLEPGISLLDGSLVRRVQRQRLRQPQHGQGVV